MESDSPQHGARYGQVTADPTGPVDALNALPLFHAAWLFAVGIAVSQALWFRPSLELIALGLVAVVCGAAAVKAQRIAWLPLAVLWLLLGSWCARMEPRPAPVPELATLSDNLLRAVEGTVVDVGPVRGETEQSLDEPAANQQEPSQRIDLRVSSVEVVNDSEDVQVPVKGGVRLTVRWPQNLAGPQLFQCGDRVRAVARLLPPEVYHDPGVWSREEFLLDQGITSTATVNIERVERIGRASGIFPGCRLNALQRSTSTRLLALPAAMRKLPAPLRLSQDDAVMLAAMVTGDRTFLTHSLRVGFERTGSFHMLVVSGFHLAIVAGCIFWVAKKLRLPRVPATLVTIAASFAYALFTGFATPVERSLFMVTVYLLGRLVYRERNAMNTIGFAALCLLAASPRSLFDASFQMTLLAVVAIGGIAAPLLQTTLHPYLIATRDLRLVALDVKLAPPLAQFRVVLRIFAAALQSAIGARSSGRDSAPTEGNTDAPPQLLLFQATMGMASALFQAVFRGSLAASAAWRFFPWTVRILIRIVELLVVSCVVELAMALPMALYFHRITVFALPVNIFILPLLAVLMPAALVTLLLALIGPAYAVVPAMIVAVFLHIGVWLVRMFGSMAWGDLRIPAPLLWQSVVFCLLLAVAIVLSHLSGKSNDAAKVRHPSLAGTWLRRAAWAALLLAALVAVAPRPVDHPRDALLVEAIDVGQGDSLLLIAPDGRAMLVDGGGFGGGPHQAPQDYDI
ncbi:MAG: ComEC/Rec2 family competence protein, partial [Terracidiphilus sp.]